MSEEAVVHLGPEFEINGEPVRTPDQVTERTLGYTGETSGLITDLLHVAKEANYGKRWQRDIGDRALLELKKLAQSHPDEFLNAAELVSTFGKILFDTDVPEVTRLEVVDALRCGLEFSFRDISGEEKLTSSDAKVVESVTKVFEFFLPRLIFLVSNPKEARVIREVCVNLTEEVFGKLRKYESESFDSFVARLRSWLDGDVVDGYPSVDKQPLNWMVVGMSRNIEAWLNDGEGVSDDLIWRMNLEILRRVYPSDKIIQHFSRLMVRRGKVKGDVQARTGLDAEIRGLCTSVESPATQSQWLDRQAPFLRR